MPAAPLVEDETVGIRAGHFTWNTNNGDANVAGGNKRNFTLRIDGEVFFKRGCVNLIVGQTGSGKTSLLMALLGEMHYTSVGQDPVVSLPRGGGVAYHAQESWVLNVTIRVRSISTTFTRYIFHVNASGQYFVRVRIR